MSAEPTEAIAPFPDDPTLLAGVARFLMADVRPAVQDAGLRFRLLVAASVLQQVGAGLGLESTAVDDKDPEAIARWLRQQLAVANPRFDLSEHIEGGQRSP